MDHEASASLPPLDVARLGSWTEELDFLFMLLTNCYLVELATNIRKGSYCSEMVATRAFSLLKAHTSAFTLKMLNGHWPIVSIDVKLGR